MKYQGPERRAHIRIGKSLVVTYAVIDVEEAFEASLSNVSGGGMRLPLKNKLVPGTRLKIKLELLKEKKRIQLEGRVIWVRPSREDNNFPYEAGVEFINIDFAKRTMLSNFIQYLNRERLLREFFT